MHQLLAGRLSGGHDGRSLRREAQFGDLSGTLWILIGGTLASGNIEFLSICPAVQDS